MISSENNNMEFWKNEINIDSFLSNNTSYLKCKSIEIPIKDKNNKIFLTGGTGFMGAYLIESLISKDNVDVVFCLSRNKNNLVNIRDTIINNLKHHYLYDKLSEHELSKIQVVYGDASKSKLGLSDDDYNLISNQCNLIIHSSADINLRSDYIKIRETNVYGLKEIIKLSLSKCSSENNESPIGIAFVSTYSIFLKQELQNEIKRYDEQLVGLVKLENIEKTMSGYVQSKIISEHILTKASNEKSIPYMILRVPSIFSHPETGVGHDLDPISHTFRCVCELEVCPTIHTQFFCAPITWVIKNTMALIFNDHSQNGWLLLNQNRDHLNAYNIYGETHNILNVFNNTFKLTDFEEWCKMVKSSNSINCLKFNKPINFFIIQYFDFSNQFGVSIKTKQLLQSLGTYEDGGIITTQMVLNHYNKGNK